jgi:RNA-directed DNA polymerase
VVDADIEACFDTIDHTALLGRLRRRIEDKRVLALLKAFLKAGVLTVEGADRETTTGTPQGGILSPLLANIALSVLDDHFEDAWQAMGTGNQRKHRRIKGQATYRIVRYADDFVILVAGTRAHAEALADQAAALLAPMGLRLSQGSCKVLRQAVDLLGCRRREATIRCRLRAVASRDRPPSRSDLGRSRVLTIQVECTAVAQEARRRPLAAITAAQAAQS